MQLLARADALASDPPLLASRPCHGGVLAAEPGIEMSVVALLDLLCQIGAIPARQNSLHRDQPRRGGRADAAHSRCFAFILCRTATAATPYKRDLIDDQLKLCSPCGMAIK